MIQKGMSLIEVVLALFIGSLLATMLFGAFYQMGKGLGQVRSVSSLYNRTYTVHDILERDISGMFVPYLRPKKKEEESDQHEKQEKDAKQQKQIIVKKNEQQKKEKPKPVPYAMYYTVQEDGTMKDLTFITNNMLDVKKPRPLCERIVYRLQRDDQWPETFVLGRAVSRDIVWDNLYFDNDERMSPFIPICDGIKRFKMTFLVLPPAKKEEKKEKTAQDQHKTSKEDQEEDEKKELLVFTDWNEETFKDMEQKPLIPVFVKIMMTLVDKRSLHEYTTELVYAPRYALKPLIIEEKKEETKESNKVVNQRSNVRSLKPMMKIN